MFFGNSLIEDKEQNIVMTGFDYMSNNRDACVVKCTNGGDVEWAKRFMSTSGIFEIYSIIQAFDSNYVFAGSHGPGHKAILGKLDRDGALLWTSQYDSVSAVRDVKQTPDSGFVILGHTSIMWHLTPILIRIDKSGNIQWAINFSSTDVIFCEEIIMTRDSGFVLTGTSYKSSTGEPDLALLKIDGYGNVQWSRKYDTGDQETGRAGLEDKSGNLLITGYSVEIASSNITHAAVSLKTDNAGNILWCKRYPQVAGLSEAESVVLNDDNSFTFAGSCFAGDAEDVLVFKTDNSGNLLWYAAHTANNSTAGNDCADAAHSITHTYKKGYAVTGFSCLGPGTAGQFLLKIDNTGVTDCPTQVTLSAQSLNCTDSALSLTPAPCAWPVYEPFLAIDDNYQQNVICFYATSVEEDQHSTASLLFYPNPSNGNTTLRITTKSLADAQYTLSILDTRGREVNRVFLPNVHEAGFEFPVELGQLPQGIYTALLLSDKNIMAAKKLVIIPQQ